MNQIVFGERKKIKQNKNKTNKKQKTATTKHAKQARKRRSETLLISMLTMNATMMATTNRRNIQTNRHESWIGVAISNQSTIVNSACS
jgi:hypothetical protein